MFSYIVPPCVVLGTKVIFNVVNVVLLLNERSRCKRFLIHLSRLDWGFRWISLNTNLVIESSKINSYDDLNMATMINRCVWCCTKNYFSYKYLLLHRIWCCRMQCWYHNCTPHHSCDGHWNGIWIKTKLEYARGMFSSPRIK